MLYTIVEITTLMVALMVMDRECTPEMKLFLPWNPIGQVYMRNTISGCLINYKSVQIPENMVGLKSYDYIVRTGKDRNVVLYIEAN